MKSSNRSRCALCVAAFVVAGCGGSPTAAPGSVGASEKTGPPQILLGSLVSGPNIFPHRSNLPHVWPNKNGQQEVLFVADENNSQVLLFDPKKANPSPEGSITTGVVAPAGLAVDKNGALYVANFGGVTVTVYPHGQTTPSLTISNGLDSPAGIAVDSAGNVFVSNPFSETVVGYRSGATSPFETIDFTSLGQPVGVAVDGNDNLWVVSGQTSKAFEISAGSSTPKDAGLSDLNGSIGISFGRDDVMYISNENPRNVEIYTYGSTIPSRTITNGIVNPTWNGITSSDVFFQSNQFDNVVGYKKGHTTPFSTITSVSGPTGIASTPEVVK